MALNQHILAEGKKLVFMLGKYRNNIERKKTGS